MAWTDFKMKSVTAEATRLQAAAPDAAAGSAIPPEDIVLLFEASVAAAMRLGSSRANAAPIALQVVRSTLGNDPGLPGPQGTAGTCLTCGGSEGVVLPFMSSRPSVFVWLHPGKCHEEHRTDRKRQVDHLLRGAGLKIDEIDPA